MNTFDKSDVLEIDGLTHYLSHVGYFRRALLREVDAQNLRSIALTLCEQYEALRITAIEAGLDASPTFCLPEEAKEKRWEFEAPEEPGEVITPALNSEGGVLALHPL